MPAGNSGLQAVISKLRAYLLKPSGYVRNVEVFWLAHSESPRRNVGDLAVAAAEHLYNWLVDSCVSNIGVGWGRSVQQPIFELQTFIKQKAKPKRPHDSRVCCIPTCGRTVGQDERPELFCSTLSEILEKTLNEDAANETPCVSLKGIPNFIYAKLKKETVDDMRKNWIQDNPNWRAVFDGSNALVHRIDAIVTSLGPPELSEEGRGWIGDLCNWGGIRRQTLIEEVSYDIGGIFVAKNEPLPDEIPDCDVSSETPVDYEAIIQFDHDYDRQHSTFVADLNRRLTCIRRAHYRNCARRAAQEFKPGVIVVAIGGEKAKALLHAIRSGLVNTVVIDDSLARALLSEIEHHT